MSGNHPARLRCAGAEPAVIHRRSLMHNSGQSKSFSARKRQRFSAYLLLRRRIARVDHPRAVVHGLRVLFAGLDDLDFCHDCSLLRRAGRFMRQRYECRFKRRLVTCRHVHVTKLGVRGDRTAARAHRNKRAVSAVVPRREVLESLSRRHPPALGATVDVAGRQRRLARETRARVSRSVRANRVGVASCGFRTGPCGHRRPWGTRASWSLRAGATVARRRTGRCRRCSSRPSRRPSCRCRSAACRVTTVSGMSSLGACLSRTIGLNATFTSLSPKSCSLRKSSSAG